MTDAPTPAAAAPGSLEMALDWRRPAVHGIGWMEQAYLGNDADGEPGYEQIPGEVRFTRVNVGTNYPAAAALAAVVGYRGGSASFPLSPADLGQAIELLAGTVGAAGATTAAGATGAAPPGVAGAGPAHGPGGADLAVWREMAETDSGGEPIYVYLGDRSRRSGDPYVHRLIEVADSGRQDVPYGQLRWWPAEGAATDPYPLIAAWTQAWPGALPIAHELKELFEERWVRFHSLPGSKRYPDNPEEDETVLLRHNTVLDELCAATGTGELLVIACNVAATPAPASGAPDFAELLPAESFWASVPWHYADPDLLFAHLYTSRHAWRPGALDELLEAVADEEMFGVIVTPPDLRWLYHPYAGGADIVLATAAERDKLAAAHPDWRSTHPSGL